MLRRQFLKSLAAAPIAGQAAVKEVAAKYGPEIHTLAGSVARSRFFRGTSAGENVVNKLSLFSRLWNRDSDFRDMIIYQAHMKAERQVQYKNPQALCVVPKGANAFIARRMRMEAEVKHILRTLTDRHNVWAVLEDMGLDEDERDAVTEMANRILYD